MTFTPSERRFLLLACGVIAPDASSSRPGAMPMTAEGVLILRKKLQDLDADPEPHMDPVARALVEDDIVRAAPPEVERLAMRALELHDAYLAIPQDRGGPTGPKGRAHQAWLDAKALATGAAS